MAEELPGSQPPRPEPAFEVTHDAEPGETLLAGFSQFGLAGLTAADYLVDHLECDQIGHVTVEQLPAITPFERGTPRHHTRLFSRADLDLTVLVGELFVPLVAADPFGAAIVEWIESAGVGDVAVLSGVPVPHGPEQHDVFYVATEDYQELRLADSDVPPMGSGFLEGVPARLLDRGIASPLAAAVFVTPVHARTPDVEASIRLVETVSEVYDLEVDTDPLESFAAEIADYYAELAERLEAVEQEQRPEDRMYM
jgi:uncharacterized protein